MINRRYRITFRDFKRNALWDISGCQKKKVAIMACVQWELQLKTEVKETDIIGNHKFKNKMTLRSSMMPLNEVLIAELLSKN